MKREVYLILDNIRSRENVGSIFRTADAVGVSKIFLCGITPRPFRSLGVGGRPEYDPKISKTALGAETYVPWEYYTQTWKVLRKLKVESGKLKVVGLEQAKNSQNIFQYKPQFPLALVVGNEVRGISSRILKYCDETVQIPMLGKKESLNVSVATGVALYTLMYGPDLLPRRSRG